MSFRTICPGCGAPSGPSVGICPFCKTVLTSSGPGEAIGPGDSIGKLHSEGRLPLALAMARKYYDTDPQARQDARFLVLYTKILLESEGPSGQIRGLLAEAHLADPQNTEVLDYLELMEAKGLLREGLEDAGERRLKGLLRRSPQNMHAAFLLGTHLFWVEEQPAMALPWLETCARLAPNYLRAWGCLAAIYRALGNEPLAQRALQKCMDLEPESFMREFFKKQLGE